MIFLNVEANAFSPKGLKYNKGKQNSCSVLLGSLNKNVKCHYCGDMIRQRGDEEESMIWRKGKEVGTKWNMNISLIPILRINEMQKSH